MKGVIFSTSFFILSITMFLSLGWYVNYDNYRSIIGNNFKKSLIQTGYIMQDVEEVSKQVVIDTLIDEVSGSLPKNFVYDFDLLGFNEDPILIRVKLACTSKNSLFKLTFEETVIEKETVREKE